MTWTNSDGLHLKFGTEESTVTPGGEICPFGDQLEIVFNLDHSYIDSDTAKIIEGVRLPLGFQIERVRLVVEEAFDSAGDAFVLDMGLVDEDRSSNANDDALIQAEVQADIDAIGDIVEYTLASAGASGAGVSVGTVLTDHKLVTVSYDTAAPTAGHAKVTIFGHIETVP